MKPIIGISVGDLNGIGCELVLKTLDDNRFLDFFTPVVFCNNKVLNFYKKFIPNCNIQYNITKEINSLSAKQVNVFNCWEEDVTIEPGKETVTGGQYGIKSLLTATQFLKEGKIDALVTLPINKNNSQSAEFNYTGHTPFLKDKFQAKDVAMLMCSSLIKVGLLTEHVALKDVSKFITTEAIVSKVKIIQDSLIKDFGISKPKIAILGLNPHAGDSGLIGKEDKEVIKPTIEQLMQKGNLVYGPYPADAFFARAMYTKFDAVLAMYHDQGLIPFKSLDNNEGVNYTAGLSVIRTSPDHGTAYDIAGKNEASTDSFIQALFQCVDIYNQRNNYKEIRANPIKRGMGQTMLKKTKEDVIED